MISEDVSFGPKLRSQAEAIFAARKDKPEYIDYEFHDFKGELFNYAILGVSVLLANIRNTKERFMDLQLAQT